MHRCPKKKVCSKIANMICRIWRSICEFFRPKVYQKKLNQQLEEIKNGLKSDRYQKKIEGFYKKFIQEVKDEALSLILNQKDDSRLPELEKIFQLPLDSNESVQEFSRKLEKCLGSPMHGKLLLLSDCFEWKDSLSRQRQEILSFVNNAKVKNTASNHHVFSMVKKAKQLVLIQAKDVKSYSHFMREFAVSISESTIKEASLAILNLDQEKNKQLEKYQGKKAKIKECIEKLNSKSNPSVFRMNDLKEKLKFSKKQLKATEMAFSDLYGGWLSGMNEIKRSMSIKICSENLDLLAFWKKKLHDLLKGKAHLDLFIDVLVRLNRICLNLKIENDPEGTKLITSGLSVDLMNALDAFVLDANKLRELIDTPKHIHDQITGVIGGVIADRMSQLKPKAKSPSAMNEEEKLVSVLEGEGLKRRQVAKGPNCLFEACVKGIQTISEASPEFKTMDGAAFRKAVYEYMKTNKAENVTPLFNHIEATIYQIKLASDESFNVIKDAAPPFLRIKYDEIRNLCLALKQDLQMQPIMEELNIWWITEGIHSYLEDMGECNAYPGLAELEAVSKMLNVPIRVYSDTYDTQYRDIGEYPLDRAKVLHLLLVRGTTPHFDAILT